MIPKIFDSVAVVRHNDRTLRDLRLNSILSDNALYFLSKPCKHHDISKRHELFKYIIESDALTVVQDCLDWLKALERTKELMSKENNEIERLHYTVEHYRIFAKTVESFCNLKDYGDILSQVANHFIEQKNIVCEILDAVQFSKAKMVPMMSGLISFQDQIWITPENNITDEYDLIKILATDIGLETPKKKKYMLAVDGDLSDAICLMYGNNLSQIYQRLDKFTHINCFDVLEYIPELEFLIELVTLVKKASAVGIKYCFPKISDTPNYFAHGIADITLLSNGKEKIIVNDVNFSEDPFSFLVGANSGGKTTYLRAVAVNLILFLSGCPVFAESAQIFPFEYVDTHFTSDERYTNTGRLEDELIRVTEMFKNADQKKSFLFFNETFSGTDDKKGFELLTTTVGWLNQHRHFGLWVTHFGGVLTLGNSILTVQVDENNNRTYRVERTQNALMTYTNDILKKYRIDGDSLKLRGTKP